MKSLRDDGVYVNGQLLPYSKPLSADPGGRKPPAIREVYTLGKSELLLMTDRSASSFDGRYFGAVTKSQIISTVLPVMTSGKRIGELIWDYFIRVRRRRKKIWKCYFKNNRGIF